MAVYIVTGKLGSGKSLAAVGRIRDALLDGKRVATNLDIYPQHMLSPWHKSGQLVRIPDKPTLKDLEYIGCGSQSPEEDTFGLIVLDELGTWLNSRSYRDDERQPVIDWLLHSRKMGWNVYFIVQNLQMIDKQVRDGLAEFVVTCRRTDRFQIPFFKHFGVKIPRFHVAFVRYGSDRDAPMVERWIYKAKDLYQAYDTRQIFRPRDYPGAVTECRTVPLPGEVTGATRPKSFWNRLRGIPEPVAAKPAHAVGGIAPRPKHPLIDFLMRFPAWVRSSEVNRLTRLGHV